MNNEKANQKEIWQAIAESWHRFRRKPFSPIIEKLAKEWPPGKILDVGCGNGRNLLPFAQNGFECYGIDFSEKMIGLAKKFAEEKKFQAKFSVAEATKLPFKNAFFDYALCIAVLHHLTKANALKALEEIFRILKSSGKALLTVWNKWQWPFLFKPKIYNVPWRIGEKIFYRWTYFYNFFEFLKLVKKAGFKIIKAKGIFGKNIILIVEK